LSALELAAAQRAFARVAIALEGSDPVDSAALSARLRDDRGIPAHERMQVYAHGYFERIHGVLRDDFPALHAALGDAAFGDLARLYLLAHPPRRFSLRFVGEQLPAFLAGPVAEFFRSRWPFAADLAALEWAIVDLFDAPDSPVLTRESLAGVAPERWGGLRFRLTRAERVLVLDWPVTELREAWAADRAAPALERRAMRVLVHRRAEEVRYRSLTALEARALELVRAGGDFASICGTLAEEIGAGAAAQAVQLLERWLSDHLLSALSAAAPSSA